MARLPIPGSDDCTLVASTVSDDNLWLAHQGIYYSDCGTIQ